MQVESDTEGLGLVADTQAVVADNQADNLAVVDIQLEVGSRAVEGTLAAEAGQDTVAVSLHSCSISRYLCLSSHNFSNRAKLLSKVLDVICSSRFQASRALIGQL